MKKKTGSSKKNWAWRLMNLILRIVILLVFDRHGICAPPFMDFEGVGGGGIVPGAYLVNPPKHGEWIGKPAFSHWSLIGLNQKDSGLYTNGFAFSFLERFEFGYVLETMDFRRLKRQLKKASGGKVDVERPTIFMHDIHLKTLFIKENTYVPAFAITVEFKYNTTIADQNRNIGHGLTKVGYDGDYGWDFDFSFSKTITEAFYYPIVINATLRLTRGHYLGLLGFSKDYTANGELSVACLPFSNLGGGIEVRQQNDEFKPLPMQGFTMHEDTFWDIFVMWLPNEKLSVTGAYTRYGNTVNKDINFFVLNLKYDF